MSEQGPTDPLMYVFLRKDLAMPPGKAAAQACHAVHQVVKLFERTPHLVDVQEDKTTRGLYDEWDGGSWAKCVLALDDENALHGLIGLLRDYRLRHVAVVDEGRTCVAPGSTTALAVEPVGRELGRLLFKNYRLY